MFCPTVCAHFTTHYWLELSKECIWTCSVFYCTAHSSRPIVIQTTKEQFTENSVNLKALPQNVLFLIFRRQSSTLFINIWLFKLAQQFPLKGIYTVYGSEKKSKMANASKMIFNWTTFYFSHTNMITNCTQKKGFIYFFIYTGEDAFCCTSTK